VTYAIPIPVSIGNVPGEPFGVLPDYDENDQSERTCEPIELDEA
jgi:hypothetical protein